MSYSCPRTPDSLFWSRSRIVDDPFQIVRDTGVVDVEELDSQLLKHILTTPLNSKSEFGLDVQHHVSFIIFEPFTWAMVVNRCRSFILTL